MSYDSPARVKEANGPLMMMIMGALLLLGALFSSAQDVIRDWTWERTTARVVEHTSVSGSSRGRSIQVPVLEFTDATGRTRRLIAREGAGMALGAVTTVRYDPHNALKADLPPRKNAWKGPALSGLLGLVLLPIGLFLWRRV